METETDIIKKVRETSAAYLAERIEYSSVHVLFLSWKENDINPVEEIDGLRKLFETDLGYTTSEYKIPIDHSQRAGLNLELSELIVHHCNRSDNLVIVYYAGHCDADEGEARWCAFAKPSELYGEPTLPWSVPQQLLYAASGDVLLILDCCNAAMIKGGTKTEGKFELLAASAIGVKTPLPGRKSFTSFFIKTVRKHLEEGITVRDLHHALMTDNRITETPIYTNFARNVPTSIFLQRLRAPQHSGFIPKPASIVIFRASLTGDPTALQLAQWFKTCPPKDVTAVDIEAIVLKARRLQGITVEDAFPSNSIFRKLSGPAQQDILHQLQGLNSAVSASSACAGTQSLQADSESIEAHHSRMTEKISAVSAAIQTPVLLELKSTDLNDAGDDEGVIVADAIEAISLRQYLLGIKAIREDLEISMSEINVPKSESRMRSGSIKYQTVVIEFFDYFPDPSTGQPYQETMQQLDKMCNLLCQPKRTSFHILPCVGYVHDKINFQFGLVFEPFPDCDWSASPIMLSDLYIRYPIVPLGHRIRIAYTLTNMLENFHGVGWVHKALKPDNILFWSRSLPLRITDRTCMIGNVDLAMPYLFGFEYARVEAPGSKLEEDHVLENNLYRHPDRWSRPTTEFVKAHDVYSLGIILFELALWKDVRSTVKSVLKRDARNPQQVRDVIDQRCGQKLPHQAGQLFADTIITCLNFKRSTVGMSAYEMQKYFQIQIKSKFERAVGKI